MAEKEKIQEMPEGWKKASLKSISKITMGQSPSSDFVNENEIGMPFLQGNAEFTDKHPKEIFWVTKPKKIAQRMDILLSVRAPVGETNIADKTYCIGRGLSSIRFTECSDYYGWYLIQFFKNQLIKTSQGSTFTAVNKDDISAIHVIYPINYPEQRTLASILSTCDEAIEKTDAKIEKLKCIKQGLMQDLFRYGIDENGKMRSEATHRFKDSPLGRIPEEWEVVPLEDFANKDKFAIVDGPFGSNLKIVHYRESGIPVIQSGFVTTGKFIADSYLYVDESKFKAEIRSKVIPGDIVMAKIGAQCGKCAILPPDHYVGILAGNCLKITVSKKYLNTYLWTLLSYYYELGILSLVISTTAQPAVNMKALKSLTMPRPDLNEQKNIIVVLSSADEAIEKEEAYKNKLLALKRGLMDDLLSGKVRVNKLIKEAA